jgi:hypothetical protein
MNREERREFVYQHRTCVFGYPRRHDGPAMTVVYYLVDGEDLLISTMAARGKAHAVRHPGGGRRLVVLGGARCHVFAGAGV